MRRIGPKLLRNHRASNEGGKDEADLPADCYQNGFDGVLKMNR
jgi:hypothetical protein